MILRAGAAVSPVEPRRVCLSGIASTWGRERGGGRGRGGGSGDGSCGGGGGGGGPGVSGRL